MSARNFLATRKKNTSKHNDCLPDIKQQKFGYRSMQEQLPPLSANTSSRIINRNLNYSYDVQPYMLNNLERSVTPFSDFFSESETETPDFHSEESDSSAGSALRQSTDEATKILAAEWERIERTLYNESGEKSTRPEIIEECKQWRQLHPQLRIVGKRLQMTEKRMSQHHGQTQEEIVAIHYSDDDDYFSESDERLSQSSTDITPQNSPRPSIEEINEHKLSRERFSLYPSYNDDSDLSQSFSSLLQITPIHFRSPISRKRQNAPILKSDMASSRWMRNHRPDSSMNYDRNSAKSFVSLDTRNYSNALSASERNVLINNRVVTARHRDLTRLEPLGTPEMVQNDLTRLPTGLLSQYNVRKVSLPPLLLEEEKKKVNGSAKKYRTKKNAAKSYQFDRRYN